MFIKSYIALIGLILFCSCKGQKEEEPMIEWSTEKSTEMNKDFAIEEDIRINAYLANRPKWKMQKSETGLRYFIYKEGVGEKAVPGLTADVRFKIELLDGTLCYETKTDEVEGFKIDNSEMESGIHEGIKLMRVGDKAKFIVPSHLAHGLLGDFDKIPPMNAIVVDIELVALN
jgi:FKBP-type peptidyl-prolyl cis-trans isomerase